jgi:hypothetical protein
MTVRGRTQSDDELPWILSCPSDRPERGAHLRSLLDIRPRPDDYRRSSKVGFPDISVPPGRTERMKLAAARHAHSING